MLQVSRPAPSFQGVAVVDGEFKEISLQDYAGKWVVLYFYPLDFTFVCPTEITAFSDAIEQFHAANAEVVGASVDSQFSHLAWTQMPRKQGGLGEIKYPLLADLTKDVSRNYGVLLEEKGIALRGLFIIDPEGNLAYQVVHDLGIGRNVGETLRVLKALQTVRETGEVCPANWEPGADTMKGDTKLSKDYFERHG